MTGLVKQSFRDSSIMMQAQIQRAQTIHRYHLTCTDMHARMSASECLTNKWISPWPHWQLRSQFDVNSCWLSSAWSAYSTSSVILSMAFWQGQLPWGKALATTSCNKAPQGIHQAKCPPKSTQPFAKTDKMLYNQPTFFEYPTKLAVWVCQSYMTRTETVITSRWMNMK